MGSVDDLETFVARLLVILVALIAGVLVARIARRSTLESRRRAAELEAVFRAMADGVIVYSREGVPITANPAAVDSCGFDPVGLGRVELNRRLSNRYLDGSKPRFEDLPVSRALRGETVAPELFTFRHPDGTDHVRRASAGHLMVNGRPEGAVVVWSDVTDLKRAEEERERQTAELEAVLSSAAAGIVIYDSVGRIRKLNAAAERILGFGAAERSTIPSYKARAARMRLEREEGVPFPAEETPGWKALHGETSTAVPMIIHGEDGRRTWASVSAAPIRAQDGRQIGTIVTFVDFTKEREDAAERERQRAEIEATISAIGDGLLIYDASGRIVRMNKVAERILGYSAERYTRIQNVGERNRLARSQRPDGTPFATEETPAWRALHGEIVSGETVVLYGEDGQPTWTSMNAAPIVSAEGRQIGALATFVDLTELHQAALERERLVRELQQANGHLAVATFEAEDQAERAAAALKVRDEFLSIAAHELKTPVTSLKGFVQILIRRLEQAPVPHTEPLRMLVVVDRQTRKLTQLVNQLLEISRLRNGKLVLAPEDCDLADIVRSAITSTRLVRPGRRFRYEDTEPTTVQVAPIRIEQVLTNLLDNAAKFSPEDQPIEVETSDCLCGHVVTSVRDYGQGVPEDERETIFERFEQGEGADHKGGLGLGLYVSRQIVELHGGTLTCEAPTGGGARFVVRLPVGATPRPSEQCQKAILSD